MTHNTFWLFSHILVGYEHGTRNSKIMGSIPRIYTYSETKKYDITQCNAYM